MNYAIEMGVFPSSKRRRCYFHVVCLELMDTFRSKKTSKETKIKIIVQDWLKNLCYDVETPEEFELSMHLLRTYVVQEKLNSENEMTSANYEALMNVISSVEFHKVALSAAFTRGHFCGNHHTTSNIEGENRGAKRNDINTHTDVSRVESCDKDDGTAVTLSNLNMNVYKMVIKQIENASSL
eukprot:Awhi_evm1s2489